MQLEDGKNISDFSFHSETLVNLHIKIPEIIKEVFPGSSLFFVYGYIIRIFLLLLLCRDVGNETEPNIHLKI